MKWVESSIGMRRSVLDALLLAPAIDLTFHYSSLTAKSFLSTEFLVYTSITLDVARQSYQIYKHTVATHVSLRHA